MGLVYPPFIYGVVIFLLVNNRMRPMILANRPAVIVLIRSWFYRSLELVCPPLRLLTKPRPEFRREPRRKRHKVNADLIDWDYGKPSLGIGYPVFG